MTALSTDLALQLKVKIQSACIWRGACCDGGRRRVKCSHQMCHWRLEGGSRFNSSVQLRITTICEAASAPWP